MQSIEAFLTDIRGGSSSFEVDVSDHTRLMEGLMRRQDYEEIIAMVEVWGWARTAERLTRYRAHAEHLAGRLSRAVEVTIDHSDLRTRSGARGRAGRLLEGARQGRAGHRAGAGYDATIPVPEAGGEARCACGEYREAVERARSGNDDGTRAANGCELERRICRRRGSRLSSALRRLRTGSARPRLRYA